MTDTNQLKQVFEKIHKNQLSSTTLADGSGVLLNVENNQVLTFNMTGLTIFEALKSGINKHEDIVKKIVDSFEISSEQATFDLNTFIQELNKLLK